MDDYTGVCVGGPADGETHSSPFPRFTYWTKVDGVFDHAEYFWDGERWVEETTLKAAQATHIYL